ncbi:MAG: mechanosensitive ion channel family protein [Candidatus Sumerlaeia bacterium]|nr:mechanosensitive ion channel family protein [Candidatus Sumerlaeia bacterium]
MLNPLIFLATNGGETSDLADRSMEMITQWIVENGATFVVKLLVSLLILLVARIAINTVLRFLRRGLSKSKRLNDLLQSFLVNVSHKGLWIVAWLLILDNLGVSVGPLIAGLGVAGFVLGFAFQDTLSNFAAGLLILANNPFKVGDYVEVGGQGGTIKELNMMATTLTTPDNKRILIPNKSVWGSAIVNYSTMDTRRVEIKVGISYGSDINLAKQTIANVLSADERILSEPAPVIEVVGLGDSSVDFVVRPWVKTPDFWGVYFKNQQAIKEALDAAGVEIPFPQRVVHMVKDSA